MARQPPARLGINDVAHQHQMAVLVREVPARPRPRRRASRPRARGRARAGRRGRGARGPAGSSPTRSAATGPRRGRGARAPSRGGPARRKIKIGRAKVRRVLGRRASRRRRARRARAARRPRPGSSSRPRRGAARRRRPSCCRPTRPRPAKLRTRRRCPARTPECKAVDPSCDGARRMSRGPSFIFRAGLEHRAQRAHLLRPHGRVQGRLVRAAPLAEAGVRARSYERAARRGAAARRRDV